MWLTNEERRSDELRAVIETIRREKALAAGSVVRIDFSELSATINETSLQACLSKLEQIGAIEVVMRPVRGTYVPGMNVDYHEIRVTPDFQEVAGTVPPGTKPVFDENLSVVSYGAGHINIPRQSIEFVICQEALREPWQTVAEQEILDIAGRPESRRGVYDAVRRINEKSKSGLNIPELIRYDNAHVRMRVEQFE